MYVHLCTILQIHEVEPNWMEHQKPFINRELNFFIHCFSENDSTICSPYNSQYTNNALKYTGSSGYIKSPLYKAKYPSHIQCTWVIQAPSGFKIKLSFLDMKMTCTTTYASLKIRDGQYSFSSLLGTKCGSSTPSTVYSTGRYMWIQFKSGLYNYYNSYNTAGFNAQFEQISSSTTTTTTTKSTSQSSSKYINLGCMYSRKYCISLQKDD
jgi:hypothetical protein